MTLCRLMACSFAIDADEYTKPQWGMGRRWTRRTHTHDHRPGRALIHTWVHTSHTAVQVVKAIKAVTAVTAVNAVNAVKGERA